jgi:colanic acid/amylovoran biosynthesis protein
LAEHDLERQADRQAALLDRVVGGRSGRRPGHEPARGPVPAAGPRVLVANHWHDDNRGDSAITQGILTLLRSVAPDSRVTVTTLTESGALWEGSTRHLERFWPGLRAVPSPLPTELRGRPGERSKAVIAWDVLRWWARLLPALVRRGRRSPWQPHVERADLVVLVGGSNLFDDPGVPAVLSVPRLAEVLSPARAGACNGTPVLVLGHTLGPFTRRPAQRLARRALGAASRIVVREARSVALARELGLAAEEAPDMAFAIVPQPSVAVDRMLAALPAAPRRTLVLSARQHPTLGAAENDRLVQVFAATARGLVADGTVDAVAVVPHTVGPTPIEDDRPISRQLLRALGGVPACLVDEDVSPAELSAFYGSVAAVVAVRLHAAILAVNAGTPTFAVAYLTAKTHGVMTQVGLPDAVGDFEAVTATQIGDEVRRQLGADGLRAELLERADRRRAALFAAARRWFAPLLDSGRPAARAAGDRAA